MTDFPLFNWNADAKRWDAEHHPFTAPRSDDIGLLERDPGKRLDINMYTEGSRLKRVRRLPLNMLDAIRLFDASRVARDAFGEAFVSSYVKLKLAEWKSYSTALSPWERDNTLDC